MHDHRRKYVPPRAESTDTRETRYELRLLDRRGRQFAHLTGVSEDMLVLAIRGRSSYCVREEGGDA